HARGKEARMSAPGPVAVTGASGFLGRALCARLVARGIEVRALVRDSAAFSLPGVTRAARCDLPDMIDESALAGATPLLPPPLPAPPTHPGRPRRGHRGGEGAPAGPA